MTCFKQIIIHYYYYYYDIDFIWKSISFRKTRNNLDSWCLKFWVSALLCCAMHISSRRPFARPPSSDRVGLALSLDVSVGSCKMLQTSKTWASSNGSYTVTSNDQVQTLKDLDLNGDAEIDFKEFMAMCREWSCSLHGPLLFSSAYTCGTCLEVISAQFTSQILDFLYGAYVLYRHRSVPPTQNVCSNCLCCKAVTVYDSSQQMQSKLKKIQQ